jgi:hypothetical protein
MYVHYTVVLVPGNPLRSYRGNLTNMCVCILYFRSGARSARMCTYLYQTVVLVPGDPQCSYGKHVIICALLYHLHFGETEFCVMSSPPSGGFPRNSNAQSNAVT